MSTIESSLWHKVFVAIIAVSVAGCATLQPVANTPPPADTIYVVQRGDTLAEIAQKVTGTADNWKPIAQHNGIANPGKLRLGQQLVIPANLAGASATQPNLAAGQSTTAANQSSVAANPYNPSGSQSNPADPSTQTSAASSTGTNPHLATIQGAIGGAVIAGLAAALLGGDDHRARNAAIGAAAGAFVGGLVGSEIDKRRRQYASTEDFYDAQIRQTAQLNQALAENNRNLRNSVQADQNEINSLVSRYQAGRATKSQLLASKQMIEQKAASNRQKLATAQQELKFQREVLNELQARGPSPRGDEMRRQVTQLEGEINSLQQTVDQMASQSTTLGRYM